MMGVRKYQLSKLTELCASPALYINEFQIFREVQYEAIKHCDSTDPI